ncbi:hypothetical protein AF540_19610 [Salmonella enterica subsp. houtenae serovar O:11:g,z25:-]|uniref:Uncharacterized protein n=1 Tax=Salmonella enterica TaxID=28901 RepID=A0A3R0PNE1_SALER|nr:hypothetical protein [Salmonella enterica subsp. houtenae serovar O:11:g,z25:-]EBH8127770.1 hypothetical protein [Salmonella enterica subsp. houtenae serovar O:11:g,z25:-]MJX47125.1 hypothetical protein [Salmonella enterica]
MSGFSSIFKRGNSVINPLRFSFGAGYISCVAPQRATGRCNPSNRTATPDAPCVFFYVVTHATAYRFLVWCAARRAESFDALYVTAHHVIASMVAQAGHPKGWPVLVLAGIATPVWAIANLERCNSGDSVTRYRTEVALWLRPSIRLTRNIPGFFWPFAVAICATNHTADRLQPLITLLHAALLHVITLPLLPGVFHAMHLLILSRPEWAFIPLLTDFQKRKQG